MDMRTKFRVGATVPLAALVIMGLTVTITPTAVAEEANPAPPVQTDVQPPEQESLKNLELVESLGKQDECLFRFSVFPAGGVGYKDSSLPYEELDEISAAISTLRAQTLRANPDAVMEVYNENSVSGDRGSSIVILASDSSTFEATSLEKLGASDPAVAGALRTLKANDVPVRVDTRRVLTINQVCALQDQLADLTDPAGNPVDSFSVPEVESGQLVVTTTEQFVPEVEKLARATKDQVRIETTPELGLAGRFNDYSPFNGGNAANDCSNSFRINTTGTLTAAHCGGGNFSAGSAFLGTATSSLESAKVDVQVIKGRSYSKNVWVGGVQTSSSMPAYGLYPTSSLKWQDQVLVSGASTGQGTLKFDRVAVNGCMNLSGKTWCQILWFTAPPQIAWYGDSGGPVAAYDPANGRLIPLGIVAGIGGYKWAAHQAYVTRLDAAVWLYGNASIG